MFGAVALMSIYSDSDKKSATEVGRTGTYQHKISCSGVDWLLVGCWVAVGWLVGWLAVCLVAWLLGCLVGRLWLWLLLFTWCTCDIEVTRFPIPTHVLSSSQNQTLTRGAPILPF